MGAAATSPAPLRLGQRARARVVRDLTQTVVGAKSLFVFSVQGVPVTEMEGLRRALSAVSGRLTMVKNSLGRRALQQAGVGGLEPGLTGTSGFSTAPDDPVAVSKVLVTFATQHEGFTLRGAVVEGQPVPAAEIQVLAALPSREQLLAKVLGSLLSPMRGVVGVLGGVPRALVTVMDAIRQSKTHKEA